MPSPALSAAARLTALTNPVGTGRPASVTSPNARPTANSPFSDVLAQQMGLSDASNPFSSLASPRIAQALANAQRAASNVASTVRAAVTPKAQKAVAWAKSMVGRQDWNNLCQRFVEEAYGTRGLFPSAITAAKQLVTHKGSGSLRTAPVGALLYFRADDTNDGHGHAAIYLGNGQMISARPDGVQIERVDTPYNRERYLGWGPAPSKLPGRKMTTAVSRSVPTSESSPSIPRLGQGSLIPPPRLR